MKKILMWLILMFIVIYPTNGQAEVLKQQEGLKEFYLANQWYKDAQYDEAILGYEKILSGEWESGELYFNLGNSYFRDGQVGKAILNYERAKKFIPRDSDLEFNYVYALSQINRFNADTPSNIIQRVISNHKAFYTLDEMLIILLTLFTLLFVCILASMYLKWISKIKELLIFLLGVFIFIFIIGFISKYNDEKDMAMIIINTEAKFEPRKDSTTHYQLNIGDKVKIVNDDEQWAKIKYFDNKLGWVQKESIGRL